MSIALCAVAASLALATTARAGTVSVSAGTLRYVAAPGEVNDVGLNAPTGSGEITVGDLGVTIIAGQGCTLRAAWSAACDATGVTRIELDLGDMDDRERTVMMSPIPMTVDGGPGNDSIQDGYGADKLDGGAGDDFIDESHGQGADVIQGGDGRDTVSYGNRFEPVHLSLNGVADDGAAGEGDDIRGDVEVLWGGYAGDVLTGSVGSDELRGGPGADTLDGLGGDDVLVAGFGCDADTLDGGDGDDTLSFMGGTRADGGPGDDTLAPDGYSCETRGNIVIGGPGTDTADFADLSGNYEVVSLDDVANDASGGIDDYRSDIENMIGNDRSIALIGSSGPNVIAGGDGNDLLDGGGGADTLIGGDGIDVADYSGRSAPVSLTLDEQANDGEAGEHDMIGSDVEDLVGGDGADTLAGNAGDNVLDGGPGADVMHGGGGFDAVDYSWREHAVTADLDGAAGDDGEAREGDTIGADVEGLFGGDGDDVLTGDTRDGFLAGGPGADHLIDSGGEDELDGGEGDDQIEAEDGDGDFVDCGAGADRVRADRADDLLSCETVNGAAAPTPTPTPRPTATASPRPTLTPRPSPTPRPIVPVQPIDRRAPLGTLTLPAHPRAAALSLRVGCDEPCTAAAELRATGSTAKALARSHIRGVLARGSLPLGSGNRALRVKLTTSGRRALAKRPKGTYALTLTLTDIRGNARHISRTLHLAKR